MTTTHQDIFAENKIIEPSVKNNWKQALNKSFFTGLVIGLLLAGIIYGVLVMKFFYVSLETAGGVERISINKVIGANFINQQALIQAFCKTNPEACK